MFEKNLLDLVKGMRSTTAHTEQEYISTCLSECKHELTLNNKDAKTNAIKAMSYSWYGQKRIAYLAASSCFTEKTEVSLLTVHTFKKTFTSVSNGEFHDGIVYEIGSAINCLANIVNPTLAQELISDIHTLLNHSKAYVRKKAVLLLYKVFKQWPQALRLSFNRLKERLEDTDSSVVSAAVNVICELARKNPINYLSLAPILYKLLTTSNNNWMLIKIVKLLGALVPEEPRLAKKLLDPLTHLINSTPAKSLLYECIITVIAADLNSNELINMCLEKLRTFIEDPDQNLKYLGLLGLYKLMLKHPHVVSEYFDLVLCCLKDEDISIRMRALDLLGGMVSTKTLVSIVSKLMDHLDFNVSTATGMLDNNYRESVMTRIINMCSIDNYSLTTDFVWYIGILVDLAFTAEGSSILKQVSDQMLDVVVRVPAVRSISVRAMSKLLIQTGDTKDKMNEVIYAASYIVGEFHEYVINHSKVIEALLYSQSSMSSFVQAAVVQAAFKLVVSSWCRGISNNSEDTLLSFDEWHASLVDSTSVFLKLIPTYSGSSHIEVQERAVSYEFFVKFLFGQMNGDESQIRNVASSIILFMDEALNPVHPLAQEKVSIPDNLDLDAEMFSLEESLPAEPKDVPETFYDNEKSDKFDDDDFTHKRSNTRISHLERVKSDPFYIGRPSVSPTHSNEVEPFEQPVVARSKGSQLFDDLAEITPRKSSQFVVTSIVDMPKGVSMDSKSSKVKKNEIDTIDILSPLRADEVIPVTLTYAEMQAKKKEQEKIRQKEEKKSHRHEEKKSKNKPHDAPQVSDDFLGLEITAPVKSDFFHSSKKDHSKSLLNHSAFNLTFTQRPGSSQPSTVSLEFNLNATTNINKALLHFSLSKNSAQLVPGDNINMDDKDLIFGDVKVGSTSQKMYLKVENFDGPISIDVKMYGNIEVGGKKDKLKVTGTMVLLLSSFIDRTSRMKVEKLDKIFDSSYIKGSVSSNLNSSKLKEILGVGIVEDSNYYYGITITNEHLLLKKLNNDYEIKVKRKALLSAIIKELEANN